MKTEEGECRTCAVILNSGMLLGSKIGMGIDKHQCVFRMQDAPVDGFEKDVGARTTFRIVTHDVNLTKLSKLYRRLEEPSNVVFWYPSNARATLRREVIEFWRSSSFYTRVFFQRKLLANYFRKVWEEQTGISGKVLDE